MQPKPHRPLRERKSGLIQFRVTPSVEKQLASHLDGSAKITSLDKVARRLLLEALDQRELDRKLDGFDANELQNYQVFEGDALRVLPKLPAKAFQTCICSPPYWRQRDYGHPAQLGREPSSDVYINRLAEAFMAVHRVLRDDGTLWIVIDDTYWKKQLAGIPWRLALDLQRRGWVWRSEIAWVKASTPEPAKDRPTRAHEAVLLFSKRKNYFYDHAPVLEPHDNPWAIDCIQKAQAAGLKGRPKTNPFSKDQRRSNGSRGITRAEYGTLMNPAGKNRRDVWFINSEKHRGSHSAVMPVRLAELCIRASTKAGDLVLDPFAGVGTSGIAALKLGRRFVGVELVPDFVYSAGERLQIAQPVAPATAS